MFANAIKNLLRDEDGATLVEYGVALLVVIIIGTGALTTLGRSTAGLIGEAAETVADR